VWLPFTQMQGVTSRRYSVITMYSEAFPVEVRCAHPVDKREVPWHEARPSVYAMALPSQSNAAVSVQATYTSLKSMKADKVM